MNLLSNQPDPELQLLANNKLSQGKQLELELACMLVLSQLLDQLDKVHHLRQLDKLVHQAQRWRQRILLFLP